jgi:hypothetical protein
MAARRETPYNVCEHFGLPASNYRQLHGSGHITEREKNEPAHETLVSLALDLLDCELKIIDVELERERRAACPLGKRSSLRLKWTATKNDLIELLYALHAACCFNDGKASLNRIATVLGEAFGIDLSNFPRDFYEMRTRNDRTPFIDRLRNLLKWRMDNPKKRHSRE